ncbi:hypothetical protein C8F04DRAFT_152382, partial [Mycena alexandri]
MDGSQEYIADADDGFQISIDPLDYTTLGSPPFPHTPSYNGSYHNSPYSNHSELSFSGEQESFSLFEDEPAGGIAARDYDPAEYDPPQSSLLMFNDNGEYVPGAYDPAQISAVPVAHAPDARGGPYDYSSPSSNDSGDDNNNSTMNAHRSRASSISSNPHISPSPRMDVAQSFENMSFRSPNWGTDPLPASAARERPTSPNMQKPQSPPRLLMPDDEHAHAPGGFTPPTINAPEGDGVGPRLHIVPATPVSGGGAGGTGAGPSGFQSGLETLHQGTSLGGGASQGAQAWKEDEYGAAAREQQQYDFRGDPSSSSTTNPNANNSPFLGSGARQRRKSDTAWDEAGGSASNGNSGFIGQMGNIGSALDDSAGDGGPPAHAHVSPHRSSFGHHGTHPHPQLNAGFSFGPPAGAAGLGLGLAGGADNNNGFLSPEMGLGMGGMGMMGLRRAKSDGGRMGALGHRGSRSEDLRLPSSSGHLDVGGDGSAFGGRGNGNGNGFLSPVEPPPAIRAAGRHAAGLGMGGGGGGGHYRSVSSGG